ncbi:MAG: YcaO-like family protein, partial [Actinobacteria bacterium]|nr:YcaO-like family protein [Actinomycetota bacterium]
IMLDLCLFIPYSFEDSEPTLQFLNSTGAAAGSSMEEAIYNGICEIIERDSFMICYLNKLPMPSISVNNFSKKLNQIVNLINRYDLKLYLINLTTDINIFSVGALIVDKTGKGPALSMGLKAGLEIEEVIIGAIEESLMVRSWARNSFIANKNKDKLFWSNKKNLRYLDFWLNNKEIVFKNKKIAKITIKEKLNKVIEIFKKKNLDLLFVDIASLEIKKLGFSVVKVIIPTLQPMYHDKDFKYLGNKRLYNAPLNMKMLKKSLSRSKMNKIPHPLL